MKKRSKIEVFQSVHNELWYWQKRTGNGRIVVICGKGYRRPTEAEESAAKESITQEPVEKIVRLGLRAFPIPR